MWRQMCKAKLHRLTVTESDLNYTGSITLDESLLRAADLRPYEVVQITSLASGVRWVTYCLPAPAGSGTVCLNGPAARHFHPGDLIIVLSLGIFPEADLENLVSRVVFVDEKNRVTAVEIFPQRRG